MIKYITYRQFLYSLELFLTVVLEIQLVGFHTRGQFLLRAGIHLSAFTRRLVSSCNVSQYENLLTYLFSRMYVT